MGSSIVEPIHTAMKKSTTASSPGTQRSERRHAVVCAPFGQIQQAALQQGHQHDERAGLAGQGQIVGGGVQRRCGQHRQSMAEASAQYGSAPARFETNR